MCSVPIACTGWVIRGWERRDWGESETMANQVVKAKREAIAACMTCPLCNKLFREATTISECLHTCESFKFRILSLLPQSEVNFPILNLFRHLAILVNLVVLLFAFSIWVVFYIIRCGYLVIECFWTSFTLPRDTDVSLVMTLMLEKSLWFKLANCSVTLFPYCHWRKGVWAFDLKYVCSYVMNASTLAWKLGI